MSKRTDEHDGFPDMAMLARAFQVSKMLQVAAAFELADRVTDGPRSATKLAQECGANPDMLLRLCRALAAFQIFAVDPSGNVSQTRRSAWLRRDAHPTLHHAARYWTMPSNWAAWGNLEEAIRTGNSAFQITFDLANFEYLKAHPDEAQLFDAFMQHSPDDRHAAVAEAYDFSGARLVVDVGGGNGALIAAILTANPDVHGLLFDQEMVVSGASQVLSSARLSERCRVVSGNFFESVPAGGDVYMLSQILHDWSDDGCQQILANCRSAMGSEARLLVIERVLDEEPGRTNPMNFLADMQMMVLFPGAKERTPAEFARLLGDAGFGQPRAIPTRSPFSVVEARPAGT